MITVIMNTYNENSIYLKQAIESYKNQGDVQIIISTMDDDNNLKVYDNGYVDVVVFSSKNNHPGRCPKGSFYQLNRALGFIKGDVFGGLLVILLINDFMKDVNVI